MTAGRLFRRHGVLAVGVKSYAEKPESPIIQPTWVWGLFLRPMSDMTAIWGAHTVRAGLAARNQMIGGGVACKMEPARRPWLIKDQVERKFPTSRFNPRSHAPRGNGPRSHAPRGNGLRAAPRRAERHSGTLFRAVAKSFGCRGEGGFPILLRRHLQAREPVTPALSRREREPLFEFHARSHALSIRRGTAGLPSFITADLEIHFAGRALNQAGIGGERDLKAILAGRCQIEP
jgi:hypothetical protein